MKQYKLIKELENFNLFQEMTVQNLTLKVFDIVPDTEIDIIYKNKFSYRTISDIMIENNQSTVAKILYYLYNKKWDLLFDLYETRLPLYTQGQTQINKEITVEAGSITDTNEDLNTVSAYNSEIMLNNEGSTGTLTKTYNDLTTTKTFDYTDNSNLESILSNDLINKTLLDNIFADVNSVITLNIF